MIEVANGSMHGIYIVMKSKKLGYYPKLVVWPKNDNGFFEKWFNSHLQSIATYIQFECKEDAFNWIANHEKRQKYIN